MNSLEEIALKAARETDVWWCSTQSLKLTIVAERDAIWCMEYTRRLVAALGAQEPVAFCVTEALRPDECKRRTRIDWTSAPIDGPLFAAPVLPSVQKGWQPIETAPKDGTWVLAVIPGYLPSVAQWSADYGKWLTEIEDDVSEETWGELVGGEYNPTYWMPLLSAPSPQEDKP